MGSSISPYLAEVCMSKNESRLKECRFAPRIWLRYVDDVFAIIKTWLRTFLSFLNNIHPQIQLTFEVENDGRLPFLDVMIIRSNVQLEFDVFRKETATDRYICNNSLHSRQHKMSAINSMIHCLFSFPLSPQRFETEKAHITKVAQINGYSLVVIENMINKKRKRLEKN